MSLSNQARRARIVEILKRDRPRGYCDECLAALIGVDSAYVRMDVHAPLSQFGQPFVHFQDECAGCHESRWLTGAR